MHLSLDHPQQKWNKENWSKGLPSEETALSSEEKSVTYNHNFVTQSLLNSADQDTIILLNSADQDATMISEPVEMKVLLQEKDLAMKKFSEKVKELIAAKHQINFSEEQVASLKAEHDASKPKSLKEGVTDAINGLVSWHFYWYGAKCLSKEIAEGIWSSDCVKVLHVLTWLPM